MMTALPGAADRMPPVLRERDWKKVGGLGYRAGAVYLIQATEVWPHRTMDDGTVVPALRVKIGYSVNIDQRLGSLRGASGSALSLLAAWSPLTQHHEEMLHEVFHNARVHGEWFDLPVDLVLEIVDLTVDNIHHLCRAQRTRKETGIGVIGSRWVRPYG